jgi:multiple sugar transport system substrate-binding protein
MFMKRKRIVFVVCLLLLMVLSNYLVVNAAEKKAQVKKVKGPVTLRILYFQWGPGNALAKVAANYEAFTKGKVKVEVELPGSDEWYTKWLASVQSQEYVWDIMVIDSQWLGMAVDSGAVSDITNLIGKKPFIKGIPPTMKEAYMSDPTFSGKIWSVPLQDGAEGLIYRKDLFSDQQKKNAFKKKYGYELAVPDTWFQLRDIAEFFYDPKNKFYGLITKWGTAYDVITWDFNQVLWAFGGDFWDPKTKTAEGYINSKEAVEALEFYKSLTKFAPPGWQTAAFNETIQSMSQGLVAMAIEWLSFCPSIVDPEHSKVYDKVGFALIPKGPAGRFISLGGQPMTISSYSPYQKEAADFIEWFYKPDQLWLFAEGYGYPPYQEILGSERFWNILPQNKTEADSVPYLRDIWNIPVYNELLQASQELLNQAVTGAKPIKQALDELAKKHQAVLDAYYKK